MVGGVVIMMIWTEGDSAWNEMNGCIPIGFISINPLWFLLFKANLICHGL